MSTTYEIYEIGFNGEEHLAGERQNWHEALAVYYTTLSEAQGSSVVEVGIWSDGKKIYPEDHPTTLDNHIADAIGEHLQRANSKTTNALLELDALDKRTFIVPKELLERTVSDLEMAAFELRCLLHDRY